MKPDFDLTLYLVTDRSLMHAPTLEEAVEKAVAGGCTLVQLREKQLSSREFYDLAMKVKAITDHAHIPLIINDRLDIALAVDAAGVHIGQKDLPAAAARKLLGPDKLLGVSAATLPEALKAKADGADYLGVGAIFPTGTKSDARSTPPETLALIKKESGLPVVAIGGIGLQNVAKLRGTGTDGIAVVSAILASPDITEAARELKAAFSREVLHA